jgi:zinc finger MYND domain-containing protein 10
MSKNQVADMAERQKHDWAGAHGVKKMTITEEEDDAPAFFAPIIDYAEAERYVEELREFDIEEVGNSDWMEQHRRIEKLNVQAHQSASANNEEFVLESILTFEKMDVLIHDLLIIEAWKENVYPELLDRVAGRNTMRIYFILYHEATLINLMEVLFYHKHVCSQCGEKFIELVDYCARKLTRLQSGYDFRSRAPNTSSSSSSGLSADKAASERAKEIAADLESRTPKQDLTEYLTDIEFKVCISTVTIARFVCEHADALPLSVVSRITDIHDYLILVIPLIENPPWTRRNAENGSWEKLIDYKWSKIEPIDLLKVTKLEGQPWLSLYHLIAKDIFRERYHLNSFRKTQLLRVRKYLNDVLLDQLPFLADIMRYMDELQLSEVGQDNHQNVFNFQQVSLKRESIIKNKNWIDIANMQMQDVFTMTDSDDQDIKKMADLYADDDIQDVLEPGIEGGEEANLNNIDWANVSLNDIGIRGGN